MTPASDSRWPRGRARHGGIDRVPVGSASLWLAGRRYVAPDPEAALAAVGAGAIVCLCEEAELGERWPAYVGWLRRTGSPSIWHPVPDLPAPGPPVARRWVWAIWHRLGAAGAVFFLCVSGCGRAGTGAAAVLMRA